MVKIESVAAKISLIWTNIARTNVVFTNVTVIVAYLNQVGLVSVCAKVQLPSMSRSSLKVCDGGGGGGVGWGGGGPDQFQGSA